MGYKQTEVGVIPEEWDVQNVGNAMKLVNGRAFKPEDWKQHGTPIIRIQNLNDTEAAFNYCDTPIEEKHRITNGDVVFAWSGTTGTSFGARIWNGPTGVLNQHIFRVIADPQKLTPVYSFLILQRVQQSIEKQAHGFKASFVHVRKSDLVKVALPIPPVPEQRAIAEALSDVDMLLGGLGRLIAKKRDLKQATMHQLLTGQTRLPRFQDAWDAPCLGDLFTFKNGLNKAKDFFGYGTPIVNYMDVYENRGLHASDLRGRVFLTREELRAFDVRMGDVFFTRTSETADEVGIASVMLDEPKDTVFSGFVLRGRPKDDSLDNRFKQYCFSTQAVRRQIVSKSTETTRALTNGRCLSAVVIARPPKAEQAAIVELLTDMDAEITALEQRREKTRVLKQAIMQELLTGKTRLI